MENILSNSNFGFTRWGVALALTLALTAATGWGQYSLTNTNYTQSFDGLGTGTSTVTGGNLNNVNTNLNGWYFLETGANANTAIVAGTGSSNVGDTYNLGTNAASNRTLGQLRSGNVVTSFGFYFSNSLGASITNLIITYKGETWRVGTTGRADSMTFAYNSTATALSSSGTWTDAALGFTNNSAGATASGSLLQTVNVSNNIAGTITNGGTLFLRWTDVDATGSDDAIGINDFTLTAQTQATIAPTVPTVPTITGITPGDGSLSVTFTPPASNGGAPISNYQYSTDGTNYVARSPSSTNSPLLISGLTNGTTYPVTLKAVNNVGAGTASASTNGTPAVPAQPPTITSTNTFSGTVGVEFRNNITATGDAPITFSGTGLPNGLSVATNGVISGTPTATGPFNATLTASNSVGSTNQAATFTIAKATPTITVAPTASAITAGQALSNSTFSGGTVTPSGGTWAWSNPGNTNTVVGTNSYAAVYTPALADQGNYLNLTNDLSVTVNSAGPVGTTYSGWSAGSTLDSAGLAKYAIGGASSLTANDGVEPTTALTGGFLVITAIVRTDNSSLTVVGQAVTDLANYASNTLVTVVPGFEVADQTDVPPGHKRKTFSVPQDTDARKFMRLSASLALSGTNTTVSVARDSGGATFLQVTGAAAVTTGGGSATSDKRTVYYFAPDTTSSPTFSGSTWPYVIVQGQLSAGAGVMATLTKNSSGMLLVNGLPAYQYVGDSASTTASGVSGAWPAMRVDGTKTTTGPSGTIQ